MDETILFPSPMWFQTSGLAVSTDEWIVYGGPSKSLCVLEPLPPDYDTVVKDRQGYTAHAVIKAHPEKIVAVDICPEWPEKRCILTGSFDGAVKQWSLEKVGRKLNIKSTHSHEIHSHAKEEVVGVGYCKDGYAVTVGSFGHIVKWDLNSNVAKSFNHVIKSFKPVTMACSPHLHMHVAIGTKQGVLFVLDLNGSPRILYKVRGHEDEMVKVSWCPQYEVAVRKALKEFDRRSAATERLRKIQQEPEAPEVLKILDERVKNSQTTEQPVLINEKSEPATIAVSLPEVLNESGINKDLPEDSFEESVVQEDDMFDIYKDHEPDEFGHKKFQPVDVLVKIPSENLKEDYLAECQKLKDAILQRKAQADAPIGELVEAMDKTHLETKPQDQPSTSKPDPPVEGKITKGEVESSVHIHKHLLATIGRQGSIRLWSKSGKLVGSCSVTAPASTGGGKNARGSGGGAAAATPRVAPASLHWARPDELLISDGNQLLLNCNPLKLDCKNKLECTTVHRKHYRGVYMVTSSAPRAVQPGQRRAPAAAWSAAQDRSLVRYCLDTGRLDKYITCGGFLYTIASCPYDAGRVAVAAGDGHVRIWRAELFEGRLRTVGVDQYWHNVQGKILNAAWHPRRENMLAFCTAEARVGLIDINKTEKAASLLQPCLGLPIYSLCWGEGETLYASVGGTLKLYDTTRHERDPTTIAVSLEGAPWEVSAVQWYPWCVLVGSSAGAVAVLDHDHNVQAAAFVFTKSVYSVQWHPFASQYTGEGAELGDLIATCSISKPHLIVLLRYEELDGAKKLSQWKTLSGHQETVFQLSWSPHNQHQLLSTSQDGTVRIWDISTGECTSIFGGHVNTTSLGATWLNWPSLSGAVLSGGGDCALRLWQADHHPADQYQATKHEVSVDKKGKKNKRERERAQEDPPREAPRGGGGGGEPAVVASAEQKLRHNKKFLLPMIDKQISSCDARAPRKMLQKYLERSGATVTQTAWERGLEFIDIFGNINEVNHLLDTEMERHIDTGNEEAWAILGILRGIIDVVIQRCANRDSLDPLLLSVAPCVSFKYWKDTTLLYLQQIDRLIAKGEEHKLVECKQYGGAVYRKVAALLSLHDVKGAVGTLCDARLYKEALVLSRTRYMDSLAEQTLQTWAQACVVNNKLDMAAVCYIALGNLSLAAATLGRSSAEESLALAADIAHILGQNTLAAHVQGKRHQLRAQRELHQEQNRLEELPTRADLAVKQAQSDEDARAAGAAATAADQTERKEVTSHLDGKQTTESNEIEVQDLVDDLKDQETPEDASGNHVVTDKTEEILAKLPEKMEALLKESVPKDLVPNGTHKGEGDAITNGAVEDEINIKVSEKGDEISSAGAKDNVI